MQIDDALYKQFLSELEALENFRLSYAVPRSTIEAALEGFARIRQRF